MAEQGKEQYFRILLLTHIGTDTKRIDKFYKKLDQLIITLQQKGYRFVYINELVNTNKQY